MNEVERDAEHRPALDIDSSHVPDLTGWLAQRGTVRNFDPNADIPESEVREVVDAGRKAPTSGTTQMYSFVWIRDPETRKRIHELCDRGTDQLEEASHFMLVCIDMRRIRQLLEHRDRDFQITPVMGLLEGAIDASLAAMATMTAAESRGYGVCPIGNILNGLPKVAETADIPEGVLPIFGLCIGVPRHGEPVEKAPRIPLDAVLHKDKYTDPSEDLLEQCYTAMNEMYGDSVYGDASREWDGTLERYWGPDGFMNRREQTILTALRRQGFFAVEGIHESPDTNGPDSIADSDDASTSNDHPNERN